VLAPFGSDAVTSQVSYDARLTERLSLAVAPGIVSARDTGARQRLATAAVTLGWRAATAGAGGSLAVSGGESLVGNNVQLLGNLRWPLGAVGTLTMRLRGAWFTGAVRFRETQATVGVSRNW
jgi:hypothetical protein